MFNLDDHLNCDDVETQNRNLNSKRLLGKTGSAVCRFIDSQTVTSDAAAGKAEGSGPRVGIQLGEIELSALLREK